MPDRKASSTSNSSRTAAKVAVVILIVIAIAGFVLGGLRSGKSSPDQAAAPDATPQTGAAPTAAVATAAPASADEPAAPAHIVVFAPASANLSDKELAKVRTMADDAKKKNREIQLVSTVEAAQLGLAQQRATLVRQTLEQGGVPLARMSIKVSTVPQGAVSPAHANSVEMVLR